MPRRIPSIVVIGSSNTDLVVDCRRLPQPGETVTGGTFRQTPGGKGANQAVAAARAGARVVFVGCRADDSFGASAEAALAREKIDTRFFRKVRSTSSGVALILVGGTDRQNLIAVAKSANDLLSPDDVRRAHSQIAVAGAVLCQLEIPLPAVMTAAKIAKSHKVPFVLNPAPARKLPRALLPLVDTITPNEHEAEQLTGLADPAEAAQKLLKQGCHRVIVTLGSKGALLVEKDACRHFPAKKIKPLDTVGAGDCFTGWLAAGLAEGFDPSLAVRRALEAASISVSRVGAQSSMPFLREVRTK